MRILAIETSCDETAICLIDGNGDFGNDFRFQILGNALASQVALHAQYGGVFPNLAKREHGKNLVPLLSDVLTQAGELQEARNSSVPPDLDGLLARERELLEQIVPFLQNYRPPRVDAIAVTTGPGLEPCLWVGINFAKALSITWDIPIVAVNHMEGHVVLSMTENGGFAAFDFPLMSLLISGGHTELVLSKTFGAYERIGETRDDAAGEAFDKVARLLDLPYPGGPEISRLAGIARERDLKLDTEFTRPMLSEDNFDFSFSGLKTAVRKYTEAHQPLTEESKMKIAREFEDTVADTLVGKSLRAVEEYGAHTLILGGGVSANVHIKKSFTEKISMLPSSITLLAPPPPLATDNAIMIALAGYFRAIKKEFVAADQLSANGNLRLQN